MSDAPSDTGHERHELMNFITTFYNTQTRMVVRRATTFTSGNLEGNLGPMTWPGPLRQSLDSSRTQPSRKSKNQNHELTRLTSSRGFSSSRRNKGIKFVEKLYQPGANVTPNILCLKCQSILLKSYILNGQADEVKISKTPHGPLQRTERLEGFQHYSTYEELEKSGHAQCHLCHFLWDILDDESWDVDESEFRGPGKHIVVQVRTSGRENRAIQINVALQKWAHRRIEDNDRRCILIHQLPLTLDGHEAEKDTKIIALLKTEHPAQLSVSTTSDSTFDLASHWLNTCLQSHGVCREASNEAMMLPSRLIWLGPPNLRIRARICRTTDLKKFPPYFTLSHCWGGANVTRLIKEVQEDFSKAIPFDNLPKTFKDAMMITKRLGYSYIWIDSLCIIQDSIDDWIVESAIMGQIYRNSTCNLAALGAVDSNGGCFTTRNPLSYRPCRLSGDDQSGLYAFGYGDPKEHNKGNSRLASRAWVFQERMLSPRSLYYGVTGISWECISCSATESLPDMGNYGEEDDERVVTPKRALLGIDTSLTKQRFRKEWTEIVANSRCNLTKITDRLAAIHGVLKELKARLEGAVYLAGIWMDDPFFCLLWETYKPEHHRQSTPYTAPTWSWASVSTGVNMSLRPTGKNGEENFRGMNVWVAYDLREVAQIIDVTVAPEHDDPRDNGQVSYSRRFLVLIYYCINDSLRIRVLSIENIFSCLRVVFF